MAQVDVISVVEKYGELTSEEVAARLPDIPIGTIQHNLRRARRNGLIEVVKFNREGKGGGYKYRPRKHEG